MKEDFLISICGEQYVDGQHDRIEMTTVGSFTKKQNSYYICYRENEEFGMRNVTTVLKVEDDQITLLRSGERRSRMVLQKGKRHLCHYHTDVGEMMVGVAAKRIHTALNDQGGQLDFQYDLDINTTFSSSNEVHITVKKAGSSS